MIGNMSSAKEIIIVNLKQQFSGDGSSTSAVDYGLIYFKQHGGRGQRQTALLLLL